MRLFRAGGHPDRHGVILSRPGEANAQCDTAAGRDSDNPACGTDPLPPKVRQKPDQSLRYKTTRSIRTTPTTDANVGTKFMTDYDVAIVGLGPTGATLAEVLADMGCSVLVLDREADIYDLPRAVHFDDEIMRVLQWVGIADDFQDNVVINKGMRFVDMAGNLLLDWPRPQKITSNGWNASYRFHQPDLERALRTGLRQRENVTILLSHDVEQVQDTGDDVRLVYRNRTDNSVHDTTALFVVGCDGANSKVRGTIGSPMVSLGFNQRWLVVDVMLEYEMPELGDHTLQYCDAKTPSTYCRNVGLRRRWEFALPEGESDEKASDENNIWNRLSGWITRENAEIERSAIYTFKSEVARDWVRGRLVIAGDAAHLTPPFMGQGLCAGIRDVANLAWKLAACCRQGNGPSLLKTYESERRPVATEYIRTAVRLGELINRMGSSGKAEEPRTMQSLRTGLGEGLGKPNDPERGALFGQPTLSNGRRLDDEVGHSPVLITSRPVSPSKILSGLRVIETRDEPSLEIELQAMGALAVLIRPDKRILGAAYTAEDIGDLVQAGANVWG